MFHGQIDDPRSDQYALAVTLYALLFGRVPFDQETPAAVLRRQLEEDPPRADVEGTVPAPVADVLARAMARRPEQRFPTIEVFGEAFSAAVHGQAPEALPALAACLSRFARSHHGCATSGFLSRTVNCSEG